MNTTVQEADIVQLAREVPAALRPVWYRRINFGRARYRAIAIAIILVALELVVFRSYFVGRIAPPWDFYGPYNTEAFQWWELGGFFTPREWVANAWAGYPSALNLQNSAWYLPVGFASIFGPFTLHVSAIVSAAHVAFGALGTYLLVRSFKLQFPIALVAMVAAFFAVGIYSNAQHVDISRAYAWVPWLLLVFAPTFPWTRFWSVPVASFVIWQAVTGMYPGITIAFVYVGLIWVALYQVLARPPLRQYMFPLAISTFIALLLSMPRLLPYAMLRDDVAGNLLESSEFSAAMFGTLVFGYTSEGVGGDISMRSLFVPSTILLLAFFASWQDRLTKLALGMLITAVVLGVPGWPWSDLMQNLPGLGFSRFGFSDFKVFMVLAVVLLACSGLSRIVGNKASSMLSNRMWISLWAVVAFVVGMAFLGMVGPYSVAERVEGFALLLVAALLVALPFVPWIRSRTYFAAGLVGALILVTAITGTVWAFSNDRPWRTERTAGEISTFGETVDSLISQRVPIQEIVQRAARSPLVDGTSASGPQNGYSNRYSYLNQDSIASYINLKGSTTQALLDESLFGPTATREFAEFLAAPGIAMTTFRGSTLQAFELGACVEHGRCGPSTVTPVSYTPGHFVYEVAGADPVDALFNEAYYPGWVAQSCDGTQCTDLAVGRSSQGLVSVQVPAGNNVVRLDYEVRGAAAGWVLFWGGGALALATALLALARGRGRSPVAAELHVATRSESTEKEGL